MNRPLPNLQSVTTISPDGSRQFLHPADVRGSLTFYRRIAALILIVVYISLPWIPIGGHPAVLLDVVSRRFHFFGLTLATQDLWLAFFIVTGLAFLLYYISAFFGRVWCGWTCPYTVFLEHVYRRVERLIDGDAPARRRLDEAPWDGAKISRRVLKHGIYLLLSTVIAHIFLSYFVSLHQLYGWMQGPPSQHWFSFGVVFFLTGGLYFAFSWFREQFCIILCPYGRLQSVLTDDHTVNVGYDKKRGEPRGKAASAGAGDCVNCLRCVQVCPTGIDIRNGLQMECIGCASCMDACDDIMRKLGRKPGLVRYDSLAAFAGGKTKFVRPRTILYTALLAMGAMAFSFSLASLKPFRISLSRLPGAPYFVADGEVRNQFQLRIINKRNIPAAYTVSLSDPSLTGVHLGDDLSGVEVPAMGEVVRTVVLTLPLAAFQKRVPVQLSVQETSSRQSAAVREAEFLGPDPRLHTDDYLNPQNYLR